MTTHTTYKTADIVLAAFLKLRGCVMTTIEKSGQRGTFVFNDVPSDIITEYDLGQARVEPVTFNNVIKTLTTSVRRV